MDNNYKVGDYLTDFVCIYQITDITQDSNKENLVHYSPIKGTDKIFTDTIPEKNLIKSGLRPILTKKEVNQFLTDLKNQPTIKDYTFDPRQIKEDIYSNNPLNLISHLKYFYTKKEPLIKAEQDFKEDILNHLYLEICFITNKKTSSVKKMIESVL